MPQVEPRFKGTDTATGTRPWACRWGNSPCERRTPCRQCLGARSRRKGQMKQRAAAKGLHIPPSKFMSQMGHEENLRGPVRVEIKAGAQVGPIATRFTKYEEQSEAARPVGDHRPFVAVVMPEGWSTGIVMFRLTDLDAVVAAYAGEVGP